MGSFLAAWFLFQGLTAAPGVRVQDEGALQGQAVTLNCSGAGITCAVAAGVGTLTAVGGIPTYTLAGLPAAGTAGRLALVTDNVRGLWIDQGTQWYPVVGKVVNVMEFGAKGDGTTDDTTAIQAALDALPSTGGAVFFPGPSAASTGVYAYATSPNFGTKKHVAFIGWPGTTLKHTGSGNAFIIDGGTGVYDITVSNLTIQGNASSTNGIYTKLVHHSHFINVRVTGCSTTGAALRVEGGVSNTWTNFTVSSNEGTLSPVPANGIFLTSSGGVPSTEQTFISTVVEGVSGSGIKLDITQDDRFHGGTSEANNVGVELTANAKRIELSGIDLEANTTRDIDCSGQLNVFHKVLAATTVNPVLFQSGGSNNYILGGQYHSITVNAGAQQNLFSGVAYSRGGAGGAFVDNGTNTYKEMVVNYFSFTFDNNQLPQPTKHGAVAFASLGTPANGTFAYCSDCTMTNPCAGSGTGAMAHRLNGAWVCGDFPTATDDSVLLGNGTVWQVKTIPNCGESGTLNYDTATNTFSCLTDSGGGGGGNFVEVEVDFGASGNTTATAVVTSQTWVGASSVILCTPTMFSTADRDDGDEDAIIEGLTVGAHTRVAGTGFTVVAHPENGVAYGKYKVHCTGS